MTFDQNSSMLFSDLNVPEVFISEYMCMANGDYVKIYMYCLFLSKYSSEVSPLDLSKRLCLPIKTVEEGLKYWETNNVIIKKQKGYSLVDLKKSEVDKLYKPKLTSSLEEAIDTNSKNIVRTQVVNAINNCFFQGVMSPTWYTDIDSLFNKYHFDEDVMLSLFQYCFDRQALHKNYISAVADGWYSNGIRTMNDLDKYYIEFEKTSKIKKSICKKLGITRNLSQYEEAYIDKWILDYKYPLDVIEIALKKTTSKTNPNFNYLDKIISDWHDRKLSTSSDIEGFLKDQKQKQKDIKSLDGAKSSTKCVASQSTDYGDFSQFYINA